MLVMVIGCGQVGSLLSRDLLRLGHDVIVVEQDPRMLASIDDLDCVKVVGVPMDQEMLARAGIAACDAVCCVTSNENINIMTAEVCQRLFKVPQVLVRTMNTSNSLAFRKLGLNTINSTRIVVERLQHELQASSELGKITLADHPLRFNAQPVPEAYAGQPLTAVAKQMKRHLIGLLRGDQLLLDAPGLTVEAGDTLVLVLGEGEDL